MNDRAGGGDAAMNDRAGGGNAAMSDRPAVVNWIAAYVKLKPVFDWLAKA